MIKYETHQGSTGQQAEMVIDNPNLDYQASVEKTMKVNDMYIDAIQTKLKLLDKL